MEFMTSASVPPARTLPRLTFPFAVPITTLSALPATDTSPVTEPADMFPAFPETFNAIPCPDSLEADKLSAVIFPAFPDMDIAAEFPSPAAVALTEFMEMSPTLVPLMPVAFPEAFTSILTFPVKTAF